MPEADEGGPEMVSFRELARRLVADGVVQTMSNQRISQLARDDPAFPPVVKIGRSKAVDYRVARPYFAGRVLRPGARTDLHPPAAE
ncbi:hypothetical protein AB0M10_32925 [Streptomyces sp. NPDC051840]|uniref:hypothetical protein n=1 Tax=Streptomyces sp. NPDC051840 TaxID=3154752 RepID=UPI003420A961